MKHFLLFVFLVLVSAAVKSHQWTPTYPELERSHIKDVRVVDMELWNKRDDVRFYELKVFDAEWRPVPFATRKRVLEVPHLKTQKVEIYIRERDASRVTYICSRSKIVKEDVDATPISSRICSKIKT
jgi:hypothetical protein